MDGRRSPCASACCSNKDHCILSSSARCCALPLLLLSCPSSAFVPPCQPSGETHIRGVLQAKGGTSFGLTRGAAGVTSGCRQYQNPHPCLRTVRALDLRLVNHDGCRRAVGQRDESRYLDGTRAKIEPLFHFSQTVFLTYRWYWWVILCLDENVFKVN
jgi:hypothetical protein